MKTKAYLLFDIGGSKMRFSFSKDGKTLSDPVIVPVLKDFNEGIQYFSRIVQEFSREHSIQAAAGGIAGPLDSTHTLLVNSPNLPGWIGKPLKTELEKIIGAPVYLENDTAIAGLGEAVMGAGRGYGIVVYITVSTGVGGVRIVDDAIDRNAMGFEIGHQIIDIDASQPTCSSCKTPGHLEAFISGSALEQREGKKPYEITDPKIWETEARILAYGLNNTIVYWSPDVIVLGGSVITGNSLFPLDKVRSYVKEMVAIFPQIPEIKKAELGDASGLYGALVLLPQKRGA